MHQEFSNSEQANQKPEKFDDKSREIKIENERNQNQRRARGVEQGIEQIAAFDALGLQQNICDDNDSRADSADEIVPGELHQKIILKENRKCTALNEKSSRSPAN